MLSAILLAFIASPFPFEIDSGPSVELVVGSLFQDRMDDPSLIGGVRVSGFSLDTRDRVITAEFQALTKIRFSGTTSGNPKLDSLLEGLLVAYEFYHPAALRVGLGGGVEHRESEWSPVIVYRGGLGYYWASSFAIFGDLTGRQIFREQRRVAPLELGLSVQFIF